jgi:hypothetical protein
MREKINKEPILQNEDEQYKKKFKYKYPELSKSLGAFLLITWIIYLVIFPIKDAIIAVRLFAEGGFIFIALSIYLGSIGLSLIGIIIIEAIFFKKSKNGLERDKEIKLIKDKYKKLREIKRHEEMMKKLNNVPLEN